MPRTQVKRDHLRPNKALTSGNKTATASATMTPIVMEELMAKMMQPHSTPPLQCCTTTPPVSSTARLFRAIYYGSCWESLARFMMHRLGRVVFAVLYPAQGRIATALRAERLGWGAAATAGRVQTPLCRALRLGLAPHCRVD